MYKMRLLGKQTNLPFFGLILSTLQFWHFVGLFGGKVTTLNFKADMTTADDSYKEQKHELQNEKILALSGTRIHDPWIMKPSP